MKKRVVVIGASGKMGRESVKAILADDELELVGAIASAKNEGKDIGQLIGEAACGVFVKSRLTDIVDKLEIDVILDLTNIDALRENAPIALSRKIPMVVGTTGLTALDKAHFKSLVTANEATFFYVPNFAIGAVLMMRFAKMAASYMPYVEVIERHHEMKLDAPSGTAIATLAKMAEARKGMKLSKLEEKELIDGARGGEYQGMRVHSLRMQGYNAHQEVIFGDVGQTLTISHDSIHRSSFMPGVLLALKKVPGLRGYVEDLDTIL